MQQGKKVRPFPPPGRSTPARRTNPPFLRTLLKSNPKPVMLTSQAPVILLKADILPTWPIYSPILPTPIPPMLEWANPNSSAPTIGETRESKLAVRREGKWLWARATTHL